MKVTIVAPYTLPIAGGGFESQVYHIYNGLKSLGVDVAWHNLENSSFDGIDILQVMSTDASMIPLMKAAKSKGVKVVLTPMQGSRATSNTYLKTALFFSKIPQLFTTHKLTYNTIHCADFLTPLCKYEAERMTNVYGFNKDKITIIPNGIDDTFFNNDVTNIKTPYQKYILTVGRIEKNKNQQTLIEVANSLNMNLIIVGEPGNNGTSYLQKCQSIASDNIYFWGGERDLTILKQLYRHASLTVIPSYSEMVPLVAFESLSQKTPVVCTNRCGIAKDVIPGLFFSNIDKHSLTNSIVNALKYDKNVITNKGIYTWNNIAALYNEVYLKLIRNN